MFTNKQEVLKVARQRAYAMPTGQRFTALDLIEQDIPATFVSDIGAAIAGWNQSMSFHYRKNEQEALAELKFVDSRVGRIRSFEWVGEE